MRTFFSLAVPEFIDDRSPGLLYGRLLILRGYRPPGDIYFESLEELKKWQAKNIEYFKDFKDFKIYKVTIEEVISQSSEPINLELNDQARFGDEINA